MQQLYNYAIRNNHEDANLITELDKRINDCRHYLMGVRPENLTVEDALEALGFQRNGLFV